MQRRDDTRFTNTFKKKAVVMEFPELGSNPSRVKENTKKEDMNPVIGYIDIVKTEENVTPSKDTSYGLERGHVRYTRDMTSGKVIVESNYFPVPIQQKPRTSYNKSVNNGLEKLFQRWEVIKRETIELKGEDYYARISGQNQYDNTDESEAAPEDLEDDELDW